MTQQELNHHESPASIRSEVFAHRMRGLDEAEVREYLDILADQVEEADAVRASQRSEIEQLRTENRRLREEMEQSSTEISPQAVALFSQAQQVADQLVEEAVTHARDLMMSARHQQRDIIQRAHDSAEQVARRTGAHDIVTGARPASGGSGLHDSGPGDRVRPDLRPGRPGPVAVGAGRAERPGRPAQRGAAARLRGPRSRPRRGDPVATGRRPGALARRHRRQRSGRRANQPASTSRSGACRAGKSSSRPPCPVGGRRSGGSRRDLPRCSPRRRRGPVRSQHRQTPSQEAPR